MVGRDATHPDNSDGKLGFSYSAVSGGCVKDNLTGLIWEVKTTDGGLRDWTKTYTNFDNATQLQKWDGATSVKPSQAEIDAATNTLGYAAAVNATRLCGYSDWRMPTADELQGIVDYGVAEPGPTIDGTWFPNTQGEIYWTSSLSVANPYIQRGIWVVFFNIGHVHIDDRSNAFYARLVR